MKTFKKCAAGAFAAALMALLAAAPAHAITSAAIADEDPMNGLGDSMEEKAGPGPDYGGQVVNGILSSPAEEQTVIIVTQEAPAPVPAAPRVTKPGPVTPPAAPAPTPVLETQETQTPKPRQNPQTLVALEDTGSKQVLGVSVTRDKLSAYYDDLKKEMTLMEENHRALNNFILTIMLALVAVVPLQIFSLLVMYRIEGALQKNKDKRIRKR